MPEHEPLFHNSDEQFHGSHQNGRSPVHHRRGPVAGRGVSIFCGHMLPAQWPEHSHDRLEIAVLFDSAICDFSWRSSGGQQHQQRVGANQLWVIGPGQSHSGIWRHSASLVMLHVECDFLHAAVGKKVHDVTVHEFARMARSDLVIWEAASVFRRLCHDSRRHHDLYLESLGTLFATHVLDAHFGVDRVVAHSLGLSPKQLRCVTDYIEVHLKEPIQVKDLAREACLSQFHFSRLFKRTTGLTPYCFLIRERVERAHELLRSGNYRVAEVAYAVGFCDQSHLDRNFRRHFGFPPKFVLQKGR